MPSTTGISPAANSLEVLIVEDDVDTCELLAEFVHSQGLQAATAHDGRAAIAAIERAPSQFSIVITDLHLPGADGFEVLKAARAANASAYVVIITGYATMDSAIRAVREGAYDYLAKPFALGQLEVVMRRIRDRISLEQENRALIRQIGGERDGSGTLRELMPRLDAIEERLSTIERLLRDRARF